MIIRNSSSEFIEKYIKTLLTIPSARLVAGGREILMRCRYCPDSRDPKSAHMYVSIPSEGDPSKYNCFKCRAKGVVTHEKLIQWGLYNEPDVLVGISLYNKNIMKLDKNKKYRDKEVYILNNNFISQNKLSEVKLKYINNRLGTNLTYDDLISKKIILNIEDLLVSNNINKYTRDVNIMNQLNNSFIGFITQDNAFINMRNLTPGKVDKSIDTRYVNYNIFGKYDNTQKYYTLPTNIDLLNPNRIKIHISEGPFDILSVYYNLRRDDNNCIYSSILGNSYMNICKHFINNMKLINIEIHIYIDNDVNDYIIKELRDMLYVFQIPFYLHRNVYPGEKDFGVPISRIEERIQRVV